MVSFLHAKYFAPQEYVLQGIVKYIPDYYIYADRCFCWNNWSKDNKAVCDMGYTI